MLLDRKTLKDLVALRHDSQSLPNDLVRIAPRSLAAGPPDLLAVENDGAALPAGKSGNRVKQRRLSMTIESNDADFFAGMDNEIEVVNDPQWSITCGKTIDFQDFRHFQLNASQNRLRGPRRCR